MLQSQKRKQKRHLRDPNPMEDIPGQDSAQNPGNKEIKLDSACPSSLGIGGPMKFSTQTMTLHLQSTVILCFILSVISVAPEVCGAVGDANFRASRDSTEMDNLIEQNKSHHLRCREGEILVNLPRVFCTILDPPKAHKKHNPQNVQNLLIPK